MSESSSYSGDPGIQREEKNKKLIEAAGSGDHEGVSRALEDGAEIFHKNKHGLTGLHIGAVQGHDSVVKTFLEIRQKEKSVVFSYSVDVEFC